MAQIDKRSDNKGKGLDRQHSGYPALFAKVGDRFPKIPIIRHQEGVTQNFGKMTF